MGPIEPPIKWIIGALSHGVKWPSCEADHSLLSVYVVEYEWSYTATPSYAFMECKGIKVIYSFDLTECVHVHQKMMYTVIQLLLYKHL
jgi:Predicted nucleic acid-binding protein, contains PIN domain